MNNEFKLPFYAKASLFIIGMVAFIFVLYVGKGIIVPLIFAVIIAIVLHPIVNFLVKMKINRVLAIAITLFLAILVIAALGSFLFSRINNFSDSWPKLVDKVNEVFNEFISWTSNYLDITSKKNTSNGLQKPKVNSLIPAVQQSDKLLLM